MLIRGLQNSAVYLLVLLKNEFADMLRCIVASISMSDAAVSEL